MDKVKLKRLKIEKYRNVAPGTELVFNDGFNVLLGQNGTGKTTLLNLISMVTASRFGSLKETEFSFSYTLEFTGGDVSVTFESGRDRSGRLPGEFFSWSYNVVLTFEGLPGTLTAHATREGFTVQDSARPKARATGSTVNPFEQNWLLHMLPLIQFILSKESQEKIAHNVSNLFSYTFKSSLSIRRFDEILGGLDSITGAVDTSDVPSASFKLERLTSNNSSREVYVTFVPQQLQSIMSAHDPSYRSLDGVAAKHEDVDFLKKAVDLMGFKGAFMLLRLKKREPVDGGERLTFGHFEFAITLDDGTIISHDALSYGQKRLLAFLYYVAANEDVIIADEIVNGMHYNWIDACLREIGDRQSFLTSQNPLLLDFIPFASEQDVERTFILCGKEPGEGRAHMSWKNMSAEHAHTFFRSYKTQALQVSEILRSRGWW